MSSKFFASRHQKENTDKVTKRNAPGNRQNIKRSTGVRKTGRGR